VGQLKVAPIAFARGTAGINVQSERDLDDLCRKLPSWPRYYLLVVGHARAEGDPQANLKLAEERALAVANYLFSKGVPRERVKAQAAPPSGTEGSSQSVSFELRQAPY
jgi:outer membrane protein OmpA-like peptidoglycan-associated protein